MFDSAHVDCNTDAPHEQLTSYMFLLSPLHPPHRTILAAICSELELGQCSEAGRKLDVRVETIRQHRGMLADLIKTDEHHREYIQVRGLAREAGALAKTSVQIIEQIREYYYKVSVATAGKHEKATNPEDKSEKKQKRNLFGAISRHAKKCNKELRNEQKEAWKSDVLELEEDQVYACSTLLHSQSDPAFLLVKTIGDVVGYDEDQHTVVQVKRKRPQPRGKRMQEAYQASLAARGEDALYTVDALDLPEEGDDVIEVVVQEWEAWAGKKKGAFKKSSVWFQRFFGKHSGDKSKTLVVPVWLIRMVALTEDQLESGIARINRKLMKGLHKGCRVVHISYGIFWSARPYEVRIAGRESCVCDYHLRFDYQVLGLLAYVEFLHKEKMIDDDKHSALLGLLQDSSVFRLALTCERDDGEEYAQPACIVRNCEACSQWQLLLSIFDSSLRDFGLNDLGALPLRRHDLRSESAIEVDGRDNGDNHKNRAGFITYMRHTKTVHTKKGKETKDAREFLQTTVSLKDFWSDFLGFFPSFNEHHDLSKEQGRQFVALKKTHQRRHWRMVIDYLQRHAIKRGNKETQQEFFAQLGMTLLVISLTTHIADAANISELERSALLAHADTLDKPPLLREEHYYCSPDPERGQAAVQHCVSDVVDYTRGDGRWAATKAECSEGRMVVWEQQKEQGDSEYYNGRGIGTSTTFICGHVHSDGCSADFKCATLLLYLSLLASTNTALLVWNWFASKHGKTDECDAGGGQYKNKLDSMELEGEGYFDGSLAIVKKSRTTLAKPDSEFFWKEDGVYRRWYHHIPVRGPGCINRTIRKSPKDKDNITTLPTKDRRRKKFPISSIHRAMTTGYDQHMYVSCRSCYTCEECSQGNYVKAGEVEVEGEGGWGTAPGNVVACENSRADRDAGIDILNGRCSHELVQVIIEAQSAQTDVYTRHSILAEADKVFETAQPGHIVAMETKSNIEPFWLVRVVEKVESLGESSTFDDWGVKLKCDKGGRALIVTKLMLSSLDASNTFNDHVAKLQITVPAALLRVGDLVGKKLMQEKEVAVRSTRSRAAVRATRGDTSDKYYALKQEARQEIVLKCRALDLPA